MAKVHAGKAAPCAMETAPRLYCGHGDEQSLSEHLQNCLRVAPAWLAGCMKLEQLQLTLERWMGVCRSMICDKIGIAAYAQE